MKVGYISSSCSVTTQRDQTPAEVQVLYGAAVIISRALTTQTKTLNQSPSPPSSLSPFVSVTFFHFEISTVSNLLLSFLPLHPLIFSSPFLLLSQLHPSCSPTETSTAPDPPPLNRAAFTATSTSQRPTLAVRLGAER